jgi:hypothetical protein
LHCDHLTFMLEDHVRAALQELARLRVFRQREVFIRPECDLPIGLDVLRDPGVVHRRARVHSTLQQSQIDALIRELRQTISAAIEDIRAGGRIGLHGGLIVLILHARLNRSLA